MARMILSLTALGLLFGLSWKLENSQSQSLLKSESEFWSEELLQDIVSENWKQSLKMSRILVRERFSSVEIKKQKTTIFQYSDASNLFVCMNQVNATLQIPHQGIITISACTHFTRVISRVFLSPLFLFPVFILLGFASLRFLRPLHQHHKALLELTDSLTSSLRNGDDTIQLNGIGDNPITLKFRNLFNSFLERQMSLQKKISYLEKNQAVAQIAKQVAHDIRSPLGALNAVVASLDANLDDISADKRFLVESAVKRINGIADQLLQKSRLCYADERASRSPQWIPLREIIEILINEKKLQLGNNSSIRFEFDVHDSISDETKIRSDLHEFSCAISNLLENAIDACHGRQGKIKVSIRRDEKDQIILKIIDDGEGMSADTLSRLGEKGFTNGKVGVPGSGSGLGFYQAKTAIEKAAGRLYVESKIGCGTEIEIALSGNKSQTRELLHRMRTALPENLAVAPGA